jgi:hypothetical protein
LTSSRCSLVMSVIVEGLLSIDARDALFFVVVPSYN